MDTKKVLSVLAVALLALCPVLVVCSDTEADTDAKGGDSILVVADDVGYDKATEVFNITVRDAVGIFGDGIGVNLENVEVTAKMVNAHLSVGVKKTFENGKYVTEKLIEKVYDFRFTITVKADGKAFVFQDAPFIYGKGMTDMKEILNGDMNAGDKITITGHKSNKSIQRVSAELYENKRYGYLDKTTTQETLSEADSTATMLIKGNTIDAEEKSKMSIAVNKVYDFGDRDIGGIREGETLSLVTKRADFNKLDASEKIAINGEDEPVIVDSEMFKEFFNINIRPGVAHVEAHYIPEIKTDVAIEDLRGLVKQTTMEELEDAIGAIGGSISHDVMDYDKESNDVTKNLGSSGGSNNNVWIIVVAVIVAVIVIGLLVWFLKFRK